MLHLEFQTRPDPEIPFRMLDYRARVYRRYRHKPMRQVVIYLKQTGSNLVRQTSFMLERTRHDFDVIRLWEQPDALFLQYPGLIPFAVRGQTNDPEATLRQAAQAVKQIADPTTQANLTAAAAILAGLRLEDEVIYRLLRMDILQESTVYRSIQAEAEARAEAKAKRDIALNLLRDGLLVEVVARGTGLSIDAVQQLQQQINALPQD